MDQLRSSLRGVTPALCDGMDRAHPALIDPSGILRSDLRVRGHRLQCVRAGSIRPSRGHQDIRTSATHGEASITHSSWNLRERHAGRFSRAAVRLRFSLQCPDSPLAAGGTRYLRRMADVETAHRSVKTHTGLILCLHDNWSKKHRAIQELFELVLSQPSFHMFKKLC